MPLLVNIPNGQKGFTVSDWQHPDIILLVLGTHKVNAETAYVCMQQEVNGQVIAVGKCSIMQLFRADGSKTHLLKMMFHGKIFLCSPDKTQISKLGNIDGIPLIHGMMGTNIDTSFFDIQFLIFQLFMGNDVAECL